MSKEQNGPVTVYFTFGVQYAREPHPTLGFDAHPDGYAKVTAPDYDLARRMFHGLTGGAFAFDYMQELDPVNYPRGCLIDIRMEVL